MAQGTNEKTKNEMKSFKKRTINLFKKKKKKRNFYETNKKNHIL